MAKINWKEGLDLERDVAIILQEQEENGICFDIGKARYFLTLLEELKKEEYEKIRPFLDYEIINLETKNKGSDSENYPYNYVKKIQLKNGEYTSSVLSHYNDYSIVLGPFSRIQIEEPSISKRKLIINQLIKHGWKPTIFTDKGQPKLTDGGEPVKSLEKVGDFGKSLALWYSYNHRQSQINGLIKLVRKDGRISATYTGITNTFRRKHKGVVNIPRANSTFGKEMRSLFCAPEGKVFVNADVSGLELRMLAHHMNDEEYISQILNGDIHTYNQNMAKLDTRDDAKTMIYACLYGASPKKIASSLGVTEIKGKELISNLFTSVPALEKLINKIKSFSERTGFVPSIDNRKIFIRSHEGKILAHTATNALFQANGNIITERFLVIAKNKLTKLGISYKQVAYSHDEIIIECNLEDAEVIGNLLIESMAEAGEFYNLRIPITGEAKIGNDWSIH